MYDLCMCYAVCVCVCSHVSAVAYTWRSKNNFHVSFAFCLLGGFCGWLLAPKHPRTFLYLHLPFPFKDCGSKLQLSCFCRKRVIC